MVFPAVFDLSSLNGKNGFIINGINKGDNLGLSVSSAGDVNGDGIADIIVATPGANNIGQSYVIFGSKYEFPTVINSTWLDGNNGFVINCINYNNGNGYGIVSAVSSAGDVNDDGIADLVIAAKYASPNGNFGTGQSYVVFGDRTGFSPSFNLSALNGINGFTINGLNASMLGSSISGAGDVNDDGIDDIIIGAYWAAPNGNIEAGQSYVIFGDRAGFSPLFNLSTLNGINGFAINGINIEDNLGSSVSSAGDVNGDGITDIIVGASGASPNGSFSAGQSYVVFGDKSGFGSLFNLSALNGKNGFAINGINQIDDSGFSLSGAGDVNDDGIADIIISAYMASPNEIQGAGQSYVIFGDKAGFGALFNLSSINGVNGFAINGINIYDFSGYSVSSAGDVNGDGIADIIIGANGASPDGVYLAGQSYVVFGDKAGFNSTLYLGSLNGINGFTINGMMNTSELGHSVSSAGDVNADGIIDIIVGALGGSPDGVEHAGQAYVIFGQASSFEDNLDI